MIGHLSPDEITGVNFCIVLLCSLALVLYNYTAYDSSNIESVLQFKLSCLVAASYIIAVLPIYIV